MSPAEAALCLRDIPNFATYTREEQESEAAELLGGRDPLDLALAIEGALMPPEPRETVSPAAGGGIEECRLAASCGGTEPVAGNGRCMTCGAYRRNDAPTAVQELGRSDESAQAAVTPPLRPRSAAAPSVDLGGTRLIRRFKDVTGERDDYLGKLLGLSRTTVQQYGSGRLPERFSGDQLATLAADLERRREDIDDLRATVLVSLIG